MNSQYLYEYADIFERALSVAYECHYSTPALERLISYSPFFQAIEKDKNGFAPITNDAALIKEFFPSLKKDLSETPTYNQCLWAAESFLRIQGETGLTFECIFLYISIRKMYDYFPMYHEMDFSQIINEFKRLFAAKSALFLLLERQHRSLADIAKQIDVSYDVLLSLKTRRRDIKKANVAAVVKLAKALNVRVETVAEISL